MKNKHIKVYEGMASIWPTTGIIEPVDVSNTLKKFGKQQVYAVGPNRHSVMYLYFGEAYVAPWTRELIASLKAMNYRRENFYVPFDGGDIPLNEGDNRDWRLLVADAMASYRDDFTEDCLRWSKDHGVRRLSGRLLRKVFDMPARGVLVRNLTYDERIAPVLNQYEPDKTASSYLGRYCINRGIVVFVYRDGRTFVGKGYGLAYKLKRAGYQETGMFVPFSNGALPIDKRLRELWLNLPVIG